MTFNPGQVGFGYTPEQRAQQMMDAKTEEMQQAIGIIVEGLKAVGFHESKQIKNILSGKLPKRMIGPSVKGAAHDIRRRILCGSDEQTREICKALQLTVRSTVEEITNTIYGFINRVPEGDNNIDKVLAGLGALNQPTDQPKARTGWRPRIRRGQPEAADAEVTT